MVWIQVAASLSPPTCCWRRDVAPVWSQKGCWVTFFPVSLLHGEGVLEHCLFTAYRENGNREEKWQRKEPMGGSRTMSRSTDCPGWRCLALDQTDQSATLRIQVDNPGEDDLEALMLRVCNQNSRKQWETETFYESGTSDPRSLPSQWKKAVVVEEWIRGSPLADTGVPAATGRLNCSFELQCHWKHFQHRL